MQRPDGRIRHIIVGMDPDGLADTALTASLHLAPVLDTDLRVVQAVPPPPATESPGFAKLAARVLFKARENALAHLVSRLQNLERKAPCAADILSVQLGRPAPTLVHAAEAAESAESALIVLGPHRHRKLFDFGGTTREVFSAAKCKVWVQPCTWTPIQRVLAAVDLSPGSDAIVDTAAWIAGRFGASLTVLHAFQPPPAAFQDEYSAEVLERERHAAEASFQAFLAANLPAGHDCDHRVVEGHPASAILRQQRCADLIVMGSHGRSMFESVMLGSQAHRVLRQAEHPVLVVPQREQERLGTGAARGSGRTG